MSASVDPLRVAAVGLVIAGQRAELQRIGDWIDRVADPLPTRAMALLVGLPLEDVDRLLDWAMTGTEVLAGTTTPERMEFVIAKTAKMAAYLAEHLRRALAAPQDRPAPGVMGGALLAMTISLDDVVVTSFVAGPGSTTLPVYVFGLVKRGVTPLINAVSVVMLTASILLVLLSLLFQRMAANREASNQEGVMT